MHQRALAKARRHFDGLGGGELGGQFSHRLHRRQPPSSHVFGLGSSGPATGGTGPGRATPLVIVMDARPLDGDLVLALRRNVEVCALRECGGMNCAKGSL